MLFVQLRIADNLDLPALTAAMKGSDFVFHLAANADIKDGWNHPGKKDLQQNTIATFHVLEAMRADEIGRIAFSSTGSTYGEAFVHAGPAHTRPTRFRSRPRFTAAIRNCFL
jgi:UDP-glucose 4-epimerase